MRYDWATATHVGRLRSGNEDAVFPEGVGSGPGPVLVGVADGMGGHVGGEVASRLAIEAAAAADTDDPVERVSTANAAVMDAIDNDPQLAGMGTTLTLGIFAGDGMLRMGHIGDSRAYLLRNGELKQLTTDHTFVADLVAGGYISEEDARIHPRRHIVTQSIGMHEVEIDRIEEQLEPGDRVLLCTDGLTGMVDDATVGRLLVESHSPSEAAWALIDAANAAGGHDNTTVAVVDVSP